MTVGKPASLLSAETWKTILDQAIPFSDNVRDPSNISARNSGASMVDFENTSHDLEVEKINAIKQKTSKGYKITDVNPNYFNRSDFYCVYNDPDLMNIIGFDGSYETNTTKYDDEGSPQNGRRTQSAYFRTIQLPIEGDFLKIEYLPVKKNVVPASSFSTPDNLFIPATTEPQNALQVSSTYQTAATISSDSPILLEFENVQGKPHIVKPGDVFKTYFTNLILTFKQNSPPFRVIVGFNSTIESDYQKPSSLHMWKGPGALTESTQQVRAWNICDRDTQVDFTGYSFNGSTEVLIPIVSNEFTNSGPGDLGIHIGWITEFSASMVTTTNLTSVRSMNAELMIVRGGFVQPFVGYLERLGIVTLFYGGSSQPQENHLRIAEPIRYQLRQGENLMVRLVPGYQGTDVSVGRVKFSVSGYAYGRLEGTSPNAAIVGCLNPIIYFTENPYPSDLERYGVPKA